MHIQRQIIGTTPDLAAACEGWRQLPAIGVDTEFVRERTFYPGLGLIQVSDGRISSLIDTVAIPDLEPLSGVLQDSAVTKIFHSCGEDLEVLYHRFGEFPTEVFDTQIAAALSGIGASPGYGRMVQTLFGVELPKDKTRTNWLKRPLSDAQQVYAALDVAYLVPAYTRLGDRLRELGREGWIDEELEPLFDASRFLPDPEHAYLRIGARKSMAPRQLALLRLLAAWREKEARRRNLPRNFVLKERALADVARRGPRTLRALGTIGSLHPKDISRHGQTLIKLVRQSRRLDAGELPAASRRPLDLTPYRAHLRRLRDQLASTAETLALPTELLATRRTIEKLLRRAVSGKMPVLPEELRGWRREVVGEALMPLVREVTENQSSRPALPNRFA